MGTSLTQASFKSYLDDIIALLKRRYGRLRSLLVFLVLSKIDRGVEVDKLLQRIWVASIDLVAMDLSAVKPRHSFVVGT